MGSRGGVAKGGSLREHGEESWCEIVRERVDWGGSRGQRIRGSRDSFR